jgi:hypothetical protein
MILPNAHTPVLATSVAKENIFIRTTNNLLLVVAVILAISIFGLNKAHAQNQVSTNPPPSLDIEAAKDREEQRQKSVVNEQNDQSVEQNLNSKVSSKGARPIQDSRISLVPVLDVDPEVKEQLERQFKQIQTLMETEDAFSEKLGENYYSYGRLLIQVARIEEAQEAFVNALHISKVNHGVEGIEQRPILRELFEISYAQKNLKSLDLIAKRIVFLEKKRPENNDSYAFDIMMRLGHLHMNLYLDNRINGYDGLSSINRAMTHFNYVYLRYGDKPLSEVLMPYGELAFLWYLKNEIKLEVNNDLKRGIRNVPFSQLDKSRVAVSPERARSKGLEYLSDYYNKANAEGDIENVVRSLLNTGDLNLIYGRQSEARQFYAAAWKRAQLLPEEHPLVRSFDTAVRLPNFKYALTGQRQNVLAGQSRNADIEYNEISLTLLISMDGQVKGIDENIDRKRFGSALIRAKRIAKRIKFRPIIENGVPLKLSTTQYVVKLPVKKNSKKKNQKS